MHIPDYLISRESELEPLSKEELFRIYEFRRRVESFANAMKRYYVGAIAKHAISERSRSKKSNV